jgi:hypothetical protein
MMIRVKRVEQIPELDWLHVDIKINKIVAGARLWLVSEGDKSLGVFIMSDNSLISGPVIGFLPTKDFPKMSLRGWRTLRRTLGRLVRRFNAVRAYVREDFVQGTRFAAFFGLQPTGAVISDHKVYVRWQ